MNDLVISEVFGPTFQGEGPSCGRLAVFVRLGLCNLDCGAGPGAAWACDTPFTWDWTGKLGVRQDRSALARRPVGDVANQVRTLAEFRSPIVVVSGGEPVIQSDALARLVDALGEFEVEVETNGTLDPGPDLFGSVAGWNVSPKLAGSGVRRGLAWQRDVIERIRWAEEEDGARVAFKFVCAGPSDLDEVAEFCDECGVPSRLVWIMPAGTDPATVAAGLAGLADPAIEFGYNVTTRLHVQLWGNERGR